MPESSFWGRTRRTAQGVCGRPLLHAWGHTNPTYSARDDIGKALGKHTLQFGAQYVYSQRNQDNNAIGAASGDTQGLLTYNNLAHSTGNAFADFLVEKADSAGNPTGFIQSFTQDSAKHRYYQRYQIAEPYFEDDWKVMHNLTVNLVCASVCWHLQRENRNAWNWEASRFNPTRFASIRCMANCWMEMPGRLRCRSIRHVSDRPCVVSDLGLVRCGMTVRPPVA